MEDHLVQMVRNRASAYGTREVMRFRIPGTKDYKSYSWDELVKHANAVGRALIKLGLKPGTNIGIFSENRPEWTMADLGILSTRGVVVPFFSNASLSQVKFMVEETRMELLFVGGTEQIEKALLLLEEKTPLNWIICLDEQVPLPEDSRFLSWEQFLEVDASGIMATQLEKILSQAKPDELATIIYTSGTMGEPKGVMLGMDNFMYCMQIHDNRLDVTDRDISLCFLPLSHIFERAWTYYMLHCGATNVYLDKPKNVIEELSLSRPTLMCAVPRFFEKTYDAIRAEESKWGTVKRSVFEWALAVGYRYSDYRKDNLPVPIMTSLIKRVADGLVLGKLRKIMGGNIRCMPCSGAAIRTELLRFFHATGIFVNYGYGASETTATVSCFKADIYEFGTCGSIMPGIEVKIIEGEILVKGNTVFKGYYNKPEETARVLVDGWYHTGDSGSVAASGNLIMEDRINDIFKTSVGRYVSPQKIELLLCQDPYIEQAVVIGDDRKFISALILPSLSRLALELNIRAPLSEPGNKTIIDPVVRSFIKDRLEKIQQELSPHEQVVEFSLLSEPFSIENEALTSTLKIRRRIIGRNYKEVIEKMYSGR